MSLQKSLVQPFRRNMLLLGSGWRAYYAPYNSALGSAVADTTIGPKILDLNQGPFLDSALPAGWFDCGWIKDFAVTPASKIGNIRSGFHGAVRSKVRGEIGETMAFKFREFSRMALKIASGCDVINLLAATATGSSPVSGGTATDPIAVSMVSYNALTPSVTVGTGSGALFAVGDYIVCDKDYDGTSYGLIGENGTNAFQGLITDTQYIRKTSDFVARIASISGDTLTLSKKFIGGGSGDPTGNTYPQAGSKIQKIKGWASREGGTYIQEWSALFLLDSIDGWQCAQYYPHVAIDSFKGVMPWAIENVGTTDLQGYELDCSMEGLAFDDPEDGQTIIGYRAFYPARKIDPQL